MLDFTTEAFARVRTPILGLHFVLSLGISQNYHWTILIFQILTSVSLTFSYTLFAELVTRDILFSFINIGIASDSGLLVCPMEFSTTVTPQSVRNGLGIVKKSFLLNTSITSDLVIANLSNAIIFYSHIDCLSMTIPCLTLSSHQTQSCWWFVQWNSQLQPHCQWGLGLEWYESLYTDIDTLKFNLDETVLCLSCSFTFGYVLRGGTHAPIATKRFLLLKETQS